MTLVEAIQACINKAEWGYHELTDAEAQEIAETVHRWFEERGVDAVAALADNMPADQELDPLPQRPLNDLVRVQQIPCPACGSPYSMHRCDTCLYTWQTDDVLFTRSDRQP